ncbi:MAG: lipoprotein-releasing ABC transporter permease subunit [Gammaproteobacteria bacterium]
MFRPLEIYIGLRYTRAKRRNHFISFISLTSMLGVAVGVMALITVLSVMNGFEKELRQRILGMTAHLSVLEQNRSLSHWQRVAEHVAKHPAVRGTAPFIRAESMITHGGGVHGVVLQGVLPEREPQVSTIAEEVVLGRLDDLKPGQFNILLGQALATALQIQIGDKVTVVAPKPNATPAGVMPRLKRFTVSGIFEIGMHEYDSAMAFVHMEDAAKLFRLGPDVTGIRIKLEDPFSAPLLSREIAAGLPSRYGIIDWTQFHANFFKALKTEKVAMFVILTLIVAVAAFNIVSTLVMVVTDKQADIAILRTLGLTPGSVMAVFMVQGTLIGVVGTLVGALGGIWLSLNAEWIVKAIEAFFQTQFLPPDVYYISDLPSDLDLSDVSRIVGMAFLLCLLATLYPAWRASRTQPAEALRYA